jgi:hypothetical protein
VRSRRAITAGTNASRRAFSSCRGGFTVRGSPVACTGCSVAVVGVAATVGSRWIAAECVGSSSTATMTATIAPTIAPAQTRRRRIRGDDRTTVLTPHTVARTLIPGGAHSRTA